MGVGNTEIYLAANDDFQLDQTGDLVLAQDTYQSPVATIQRLIRLILSNPRLFDPNGNPISVADDPFNINYGSGSRAAVGEMQVGSLITGLQTRILSALSNEPTIAAVPPPTVQVTYLDANTISVYISCISNTGQVVTVPSLALPLGS